MMIRPAQPRDAPGIVSIWNHYIRHTAATFTAEDKTPQALITEIARRNQMEFPFLVAAQDGQLTGFASYAEFRKGPGYRRTMEHSVMLRPDACGTGLGRAMMEMLEDHARHHDVHSLIAGVSGENEPAIAFHERLGYRRVGHMPEAGRKFGRWMDLILLQKTMGEAPDMR